MLDTALCGLPLVQGRDDEKPTFNETFLSLVVADALEFRKFFVLIGAEKGAFRKE